MPDQVAKGPREWRATELIDDYVNLKDTHYGQVRDLIISKDGELKAVIIRPDISYPGGSTGHYVYPFFGYRYGWDPGDHSYDLPLGKTDIAGLLPYA